MGGVTVHSLLFVVVAVVVAVVELTLTHRRKIESVVHRTGPNNWRGRIPHKSAYVPHQTHTLYELHQKPRPNETILTRGGARKHVEDLVNLRQVVEPNEALGCRTFARRNRFFQVSF